MQSDYEITRRAESSCSTRMALYFGWDEVEKLGDAKRVEDKTSSTKTVSEKAWQEMTAAKAGA